MSKIVSPFPPPWSSPEHLKSRTPRYACWWRLQLRENSDGNLYVVQVGEDPEAPTWITWEFFDGCDTVLDAGFDKPLAQAKIVHTGDYHRVYLDVLHTVAPTPSLEWVRLTKPGKHRHPDDQAHALLNPWVSSAD